MNPALLALCLALRPPLDYRTEVVNAATTELEQLNAVGRFDETVAAAERFEDRLWPAAPVHYELALALRGLGKERKSRAAYDRTIELDPDYAPARYDRGELRLIEGDNQGAREDFDAAARQRPDHWAVHFRLAQLSGREGDTDGLETHLTDAIRHGFDLRVLLDDPEWRGWAKDPDRGPVIARLITVFGDERILEELRR